MNYLLGLSVLCGQYNTGNDGCRTASTCLMTLVGLGWRANLSNDGGGGEGLTCLMMWVVWGCGFNLSNDVGGGGGLTNCTL